jgi:iron complex outermembrane receptor protein
MKKPTSASMGRSIAVPLIYLFSTALSAATETPSSQSDSTEGVGGLDEIVVTAQRKVERLQDVPIAVNVLSGDALAAMGAVESKQLGVMVPALDFGFQGSAGLPYLRGVGSNAANPNDEPSVAMYIDGVYLSAPFINLMNFNNIERIEVLKGPQGTLFGRNATGGVIQVITRQPQHDASVEGSIGYANYDTTSASLYATGGITDWLAADIALQYDNQNEGWGKNLVVGGDANLSKSHSIRTKFLFTPGDNTRILLSGDYTDRDGIAVEYRLPDGVVGADGSVSPPGRYDTVTNIQLDNYGRNRNTAYTAGGSLRIEHEMSWGQLVSISAYRHASGCLCVDTDGVASQVTDGILPMDMEMKTQEFQLMAPPNSSVDWLVGMFLYENTAKYENAKIAGSDIGPFYVQPYGKQNTQSGSLYAQATFPVWTDTKLTTGLRYTKEEQKFYSSISIPEIGVVIPSPKAERDMDEPTWRIALDHAFTPDVHAYISYNRGIKSGGFDLLTAGSQGYEPEILDAYELGVKSELLDRRLRFNASAFYYDYQDIQVQAIPQFTVETTNAAKATIKGFDVDFQAAVTRNLTLSGGFAVLDTKYDDYRTAVLFPASRLEGPPTRFDASGNETVHAPDFTGTFSAEYVVASAIGEIKLSATYYYNDGFWYAADNRFKQDSYDLINASAKWTSLSGTYSVQVWGRNLGDTYYYSGGVPTGFGDLITPAPPRTYGITLSARF